MNPAKLIIAALTPFFAAGAAWLCAAVGKYGVHLDPTGVVVLATAGATGMVSLGLKLIHDVEKKHGWFAEDLAVVEAAALEADPSLAAELGFPDHRGTTITATAAPPLQAPPEPEPGPELEPGAASGWPPDA